MECEIDLRLGRYCLETAEIDMMEKSKTLLNYFTDFTFTILLYVHVPNTEGSLRSSGKERIINSTSVVTTPWGGHRRKFDLV